jgi:hypothetical protein
MTELLRPVGLGLAAPGSVSDFVDWARGSTPSRGRPIHVAGYHTQIHRS